MSEEELWLCRVGWRPVCQSQSDPELMRAALKNTAPSHPASAADKDGITPAL